MRILNNKNEEIIPDLKKGYLKEDKIFITHHDEVKFQPRVSHSKLVKEYENGGKDYQLIVDSEEVPAKPAWDEYEKILRYILYTEEELLEKRQKDILENNKTPMEKMEERISLLEQAMFDILQKLDNLGGLT